MSRLALRGGWIVDGTGAPGYAGDLAIVDGRIAAVGELGDFRADREVDVGGRVIAPGFVDLHSHSDLSILGHPAGTSKVLQGVTTEVVGNCGLSVAPVSSADVAAALRPLMTYADDPAVDWSWCSVAEYAERVRQADPAIDIRILAGHNTIRGSVVGLADRPATADEIRRMQQMLADALGDGAVGLSLGLMYPPSGYATEAELIALGETLAEHDALLASHMASYADGLIDAVASMIRVAAGSGCRVQISHLAAAGRQNWGKVAEALELVDAARAEGLDVAVDFYPYLAGSTNLSQRAPTWALEGGRAAFLARLADGPTRERIREHLRTGPGRWDEILLVDVQTRPELNGSTVAALADVASADPIDVVLDLLTAEDPTIVAFGRSEEDLRAAIVHPHSMLGSDGLAVETAGRVGGPVPHPRFFGAFPTLFERYVRETPLLSLETAVRKCTALPAERVRLRDRGILAPGLRADVVVFDPATIAGNSTYEDSRRVPRGIHSVYLAGRQTAADGRVV
ncbi:N-acyl-D-amino-acid deacylase family protein [Agromyces silvae]|uniref:N-acyl-D-amino-acid deacylase family protein n=1 Tax=Agromyces silvae TaxID=3388266 RepID=UPI00280B49C6|nr:D-aminoacylase [Agromyces protaetiae]